VLECSCVNIDVLKSSSWTTICRYLLKVTSVLAVKCSGSLSLSLVI